MPQSQDINNDYQKRINRVLTYIQDNIGKSFLLKELAEVGHFSPFHFHRILSAFLGEPLGAYIKRKRLEKGAHLLLFSNSSVTDISIAVGYETLSSFSAAFSKHFHLSPSEYRLQHESLKPFENMETPTKINFDFLPIIKSIPPTRVAFVRAFGPYGSESTGKAWNTLMHFADKNGLLRKETQLLGISYDNPEIVKENKCEYNACISLEKDIRPEGEVGIKELKGGKYAVFTYKGSYTHFPVVYGLIFKEWLLKSDHELRDNEVFDHYVNSPNDTGTEELITEIYLPIK
ncbi:MAG: AraC family transcriptional regulator [Cyclobacteriaceae bacterium]|nr:AraC family transcriptional regulator [Cyclobacteriaceae bacterium]